MHQARKGSAFEEAYVAGLLIREANDMPSNPNLENGQVLQDFLATLSADFQPHNLADGWAFLDGLMFGGPLPNTNNYVSLQGFIETAVGTNRNAVNGLNALVTAGGAFLHATNDSPANAAATTIVIIADSNGALGAL